MSSISPKTESELRDRGFTRRGIAQIALGTAAALPFFHEFAYAQDINNPDAAPAGARGARGGSGGGRGRGGGGGRGRNMDPDAVVIGSNENPMGPSKEGVEAVAKVAPLAWRYGPEGVNMELQALLEMTEGVKEGYVTPYPGSGPALAPGQTGIADGGSLIFAANAETLMWPHFAFLHSRLVDPIRDFLQQTPNFVSVGKVQTAESLQFRLHVQHGTMRLNDHRLNAV